MPEYIEREKAKYEILQEMCGTGYQSWAVDVIKRLPAADVVEVERVLQLLKENKVLKEANQALRKYIKWLQKTTVEVVKCKNCKNRYVPVHWLYGMEHLTEKNISSKEEKTFLVVTEKGKKV